MSVSTPTPGTGFDQLGLHPDLLRGIASEGFVKPTAVQADAIPAGLAGRDLLACASTGSGKTAAFLLPILNRLMERPRGGTRALVLAPTRELAAQILEDMLALCKYVPLKGAAVYGGVGIGPQEQAFRRGVDILIATPGRLLDHFNHSYAQLPKLEYLVLDEADRMLDMGFLPDIRRVLKHIPTKRQTLFFSATMPAPIKELSRQMLQNPVTINVERRAAPAGGITQAIYPVAQELKSALLGALLGKGSMEEVLVFTRTKHRANRLAEFLVKQGISAARIHGNRSQAQRTEALAGFKSGKYRVLVATDIAARGIDVEALGHVLNFDVPAVPEDYIHRVGRTGRAELTGEAFTFVAPDEEPQLRAIEKAINRKLPRVVLPDFDYKSRPTARLEVPIQERIAAIRTRKSAERARSAEKAQRRSTAGSGGGNRSAPAGAGRGGTQARNSGRPRRR